MKLRTKLFLAFFIIIGIPMALLASGISIFTSYHLEELVTLQAGATTVEELTKAAQLFSAQVREYISNLVLIICLVVPIIVICLVLWIYHSVVTPIHMLQVATQNIKNGNLDFEVEVCHQDEIGELCEDFEEMRKRLKDNAEEKLRSEQQNKELISNISHDLKTPITAIKGYQHKYSSRNSGVYYITAYASKEAFNDNYCKNRADYCLPYRYISRKVKGQKKTRYHGA